MDKSNVTTYYSPLLELILVFYIDRPQPEKMLVRIAMLDTINWLTLVL